MENQHDELVAQLAPEIRRVRDALAAGVPASVEADRLAAARLGNIRIMVIFMKATGISLFEAKSFGQWWGPDGVTDAAGFDAYAEELKLGKRAASPAH